MQVTKEIAGAAEKRLELVGAALIAVVVVTAMVLLFSHCGSNPNLWFDESGQFWMSRGQTHFSRPLTQDGPLAAVLQANRECNSDPGGYTVMLHYWLLLGTTPLWIRSFSFIFFAITVLGFGAAAWLWTRNRLFAAAAALLPLSAPLITRYAFEIRAYSMEACGIVVCLALLEYLSRRPSVLKFAGLGAVAAFFLTSRYSFICTAAALALALLWKVRQSSRREILSFLAAYSLPVAACCGLIYAVTLGHALSHQKPEPPDYVQQFILQGKSIGELAGIAARGALAELGAVLFVAAFLWFALRRVKESQYQLFTPLFIMVVVVNLEFLLLSFLGKYPWCPQERWGISLNLLSVLSWFAAAWMVVNALSIRKDRVRWVLATVFSLLLSLTALYNGYGTRLISDDHIYGNIMALGPARFYGRSVFVGQMSQPSVRYLYEYGPLKGYATNIYPQSFKFEVPPNIHEDNRPIDYFIANESIRRGEFSHD